MKISVIMPTYNDGDTILESLDSVLAQTYRNFELIIVNDGSTDNTAEVIEEYIEKTGSGDFVTCVSKENGDQLNAINYGLQFASGDFIYILHSDDLFYDSKSLEEFVRYEAEHPGFDAYTGSAVLINEKSEEVGVQKTLGYKNSLSRLALMYLWLGRNLYTDMAYFRREAFEGKVRENYLVWNTPFWTDTDSPTGCLKVANLDRPMFRYRIHESNYINSEIGKKNVINGELRCALNIMKRIRIPCYRLQYLVFRTVNKLGLTPVYSPVFFKGEEKNKAGRVDFIIKQRFGDCFEEDLFLSALSGFYNSKSKRSIRIEALPPDLPVYTGASVKAFNKSLADNTLHSVYKNLLAEMKKGFGEAVCRKEDAQKLELIFKFLCIYNDAAIKTQ